MWAFKKVSLPKSITHIEDHTFNYCNLDTIDIPEGVVTIGYQAFAENLFSSVIIIPNSVTEVEYGAFERDSIRSALIFEDQKTSIKYAGTKQQWKQIIHEYDDTFNEYIIHCTDGKIKAVEP